MDNDTISMTKLVLKLRKQIANDWLGGGFKYFLFSPRTLGKWSHFDEHIFQKGWFNHQPAGILTKKVIFKSAFSLEGCDGTESSRSYFTDLANDTPEAISAVKLWAVSGDFPCKSDFGCTEFGWHIMLWHDYLYLNYN